MVRRAGLLFVALLLAACSVAPPPSSPPPSVPAPTKGGPVDTPPPLDPDVIGLTCGEGPAFHPALLAQPGRAENEDDAAAAALRAYVASDGDPGLPSTGWTRVAQLADYVQFVAPGRFETGWAILAFALRDGRWEMAVAGQCRLGPAVPDRVSIAEWRLDPAFPDPALADRTIHVLINERACASGQTPEGRVLPPTVVVGADRITITILVRHVPGGADCPGNPDFAMPVDLPAPLGDRPLFDGGVFPPRDVTKPSSG